MDDQREESIRELEEMLSALRSMSPDERVEFEARMNASGEFEFLDEMISRVKDGTIQGDEAQRWTPYREGSDKGRTTNGPPPTDVKNATKIATESERAV